MSKGMQHLWQSFGFRNQDAKSRLRESYHPSTMHEIRRTIIDSPATVQQFLILDCSTNTILPFTDSIVTVNGVLGNANDKIGQIYPVRIPLEAYYGSVVSLVPTAAARECGWPFVAVPAPDMVPGPAPVAVQPIPAEPENPADAEALPGAQTPTFARLNFGEDPLVAPVFTVVPLILPIPLGFDVPESWPLNDPFPATLTAVLPEVEHWRQSLAYLRTHNESQSLLAPGSPMFDIQAIKDGLEDETNLKWTFVMCNAIFYEVALIRPGTPEFNRMDKAIQETEVAAYTRIGLAMPPPATPDIDTQQASATQQAPLPDAFAQALLQLAANKPTASSTVSEREHQTKARDTIAKYELALAWTEVVDGKMVLRFPTLSAEFREFLEKSSPAVASRILIDSMEDARNFARSGACGDILLFMTDFSSEQYDRLFAGALRDFTWLRESLNAADRRPLHRLSILSFLPPNVDSADFKERTELELKIQSQEAVGFEKSKMGDRAASLYVSGCMHAPMQAMKALMNMRAFYLRVTPDFDKSSMGQALLLILQLFLTNDGRRWMELHETKVASANLLVLIHDCYRHFLDQASQPTLVRARVDGATIDPTNWNSYVEQARQALIPAQMAIHGMRLGEYGNVPRFLKVLWPREFPSAYQPPATQPPAKRQALGPGYTPAAKAAPAKAQLKSPPPRDNNAGHQKGFLVWTGKGRLPQCPVYAPTKDGKTKERCCMFFSTHEHTCRRRPCGQAHITRFEALTPDEQKEMNRFVAQTDGLDYAPGCGPQGKKNT
jgi:hypothetical protein